MLKWSALIGLLAAGGCVGTAAEKPQGRDLPPVMGAGKCYTDSLQNLIGQHATSDLAADAMKRSGARELRWRQPGTAATMDYRSGRLNIFLDEKNNVVRFSCG
ncbi:hypothetical protein GCM10023219_24630 [Stakelama sediminis]|uniref:Peptidase inhibitor I78 family protein n=1 Tax=Stakelama sediminis TaxID=463200 RepID=A0A840YZ90_9SPHN|nr:I78 family peptidase inhibitor [Stakelama sediminis]MBB5718859.1 hypothetical protein [Stakelama sediminis]